MKKYLKVMFGTRSGASSDFEYKIGEVNIANNWNPKAENPVSDIPEKTYYKALAGLAIRGCLETCKLLIKERINKDNIDLVLSEVNDFTTPNEYNRGNQEVYNEVMELLVKIKEDSK